MALLSTIYPTLLDVSRRLGPDGKIAKVAELLSQNNPVLQDMNFVEGNLPTGHKTTVRTGLPSATWRKLNYGVQPSKSQTKAITDTIGFLEAYAEVDKALADLNGNSAEFRASEDRAFMESMNQQMAQSIFYGDQTVNAERFTGLTPRYNAIGAGGAVAGNIIDAGGTGNVNTSIWLVVWGPNTAHGIYPKGSQAGLQHHDLGEHTLFDNNTPPGKYQGYRTHYKWDIGMVVRDWRYIVRICNIDFTNLATVSDAGDVSANLLKLMNYAIGLVPDLGMGNPVFYANRLVASYLRTKVMNTKNMFLSLGDYREKPGTLMFGGIPIRSVWETTLLNTESRVV